MNSFAAGLHHNTQVAVKGCLKDVGYERRTFGCWKADLEGTFTPYTPMFLRKILIMKDAQSQFKLLKKQ